MKKHRYKVELIFEVNTDSKRVLKNIELDLDEMVAQDAEFADVIHGKCVKAKWIEVKV